MREYRKCCHILMFCCLVLLTPGEVMACGADYPTTPQGVVSSFLKEDFTRGGDYWERTSRYTTSADSPGWDVIILISSYLVKQTSMTSEESVVEVEYLNPVEYGSDAEGRVVTPFGPKTTVRFHLVKVGGCWRITSPQNPPHLNARYVIEDLKKVVGQRRSRNMLRDENILKALLSHYGN